MKKSTKNKIANISLIISIIAFVLALICGSILLYEKFTQENNQTETSQNE